MDPTSFSHQLFTIQDDELEWGTTIWWPLLKRNRQILIFKIDKFGFLKQNRQIWIFKIDKFGFLNKIDKFGF